MSQSRGNPVGFGDKIPSQIIRHGAGSLLVCSRASNHRSLSVDGVVEIAADVPESIFGIEDVAHLIVACGVDPLQGSINRLGHGGLPAMRVVLKERDSAAFV